MMTEEELRERFAWIEWDKPLSVNVEGDECYACRYCLAQKGMTGKEIRAKGASYGDIVAHIEREHPS